MSERTWDNVKLVQSKSDPQKWEVHARLSSDDEYTQVEEARGLENAEKLADELNEDEDARIEAIAQVEGDDDEDEDNNDDEGDTGEKSASD